MTLAGYLDARRLEVDAALDRFLPRPPHCPAIIADAMRYSLAAGGKRLRPVLVLATAEALGGATGLTLALPAACAIEMIHTYSLIHDDLPAMDNDSLRRGRPTSHVVHGDGLAILAGDGLQAEAFALMAREPVTADAAIVSRKVRAIGIVADAAGAAGMVGGQAIDLAADPGRDLPTGVEAPRRLDAEALADMHARKTGALIRASVLAGAVMAGGDDRTIAALDRYAREVGLAFQIVDDILDVEGVSSDLGKTAGKDAASGKPTYVSLYGLDRSRALADSCLNRALAALTDAGLAPSHLGDIARWIVERRA